MQDHTQIVEAAYKYLELIKELTEVYTSNVENYKMGLIYPSELDKVIQNSHRQRIEGIMEIQEKYGLNDTDWKYVEAFAPAIEAEKFR